MDVIPAKFQAVLATQDRDVVAKLEFSFFVCCGTLTFAPLCTDGNMMLVRVGCYAQNVIFKILELERKLVDHTRAERVGVVHDKTVQLVGVGVSTG